jgi:hypothetical protein
MSPTANIDHGLPGASPARGFESEKQPRTPTDSDSENFAIKEARHGAGPTLIKTDSRTIQVTPDDGSSELVQIRERSLTLVQTTSLLLGMFDEKLSRATVQSS